MLIQDYDYIVYDPRKSGNYDTKWIVVIDD